LAAAAHEEELRRALLPVAVAFEEWRAGRLGSGELTERIHEFHDGPARELYKTCNSGTLELAVAQAIVAGVLKRDAVPAEVLEHCKGAIEFLQEDAPGRRPAVTRASGPGFDRYIGIDYSGAATPTSSLPGLRVFMADWESEPIEIQPPLSPRKYWTRRGIAEWLAALLSGSELVITGIGHGFSFPLRYFQKYDLVLDWGAFLDDFQRHWPTDEEHVYVDFVRDGSCGSGAARTGERGWRRLTEIRAGAAKSVFQFDVQGTVAKSTHAGIPWLRYLRGVLGSRVHFWPFDGWTILSGKSAIVEVYPALWSRSFARENRTLDQHDAWSVAEQLRRLDRDGKLGELLSPGLTEQEQVVAEVEGWILGVG
jgi:hypothetical protein